MAEEGGSPPPESQNTPEVANAAPSPSSSISESTPELNSSTVIKVKRHSLKEPASPVPSDAAAAAAARRRSGSTVRGSRGSGQPVDYSMAQALPFDERFSFGALTPAEMNVQEEVEAIEEPEDGIEPRDLDVPRYNEERGRIRFVPYVPTKFSRQLPALKGAKDLPDEQKIMELSQLQTHNPVHVTYIQLANLRLSSEHINFLVGQLKFFQKVEILVLRRLGLQFVHQISLPALRYLDLQGNAIEDARTVASMVNKSPYLEYVDVRHNPCDSTPNCKLIILGGQHNLKSVNGEGVSIEERALAAERYGPQESRQFLPYLRWDWTMNVVVERANMLSWEPAKIVNLNLTNAKLQAFHVGTFVSLQSFDVSGNELTTLEGMGLEQCSQLHRLNVSKNRIADPNSIKVFYFTPALRQLSFEGNPLQDYRSMIVYQTLSLRGTNRCPGLIEIDGQEVTLDERLKALKRFAKPSATQLELARWNYSVIRLYGHHQLQRIPNFLERIRKLEATNMDLQVADLQPMPLLEVVILSKNNLSAVTGIESLKNLRYFDVSGNPRLRTESMYRPLQAISSLEVVLLAQDLNEYNTAPNAIKPYRLATLQQLLHVHGKLRCLDIMPIDINERVDVFTSLGLNPADAEAFRFFLALLMTCTTAESRSYHPKDVKPGIQYNPIDIKVLHLQGRNISNASPAVNFSAFINLEKLDLADNRITDLDPLKLTSCTKLEVFDLARNQLRSDTEKLSTFINQMASIEIICLRDNPCMRQVDRKRLVGSIERLREVDSRLRIIDTEISTNERVEGWKARGTSEEQCEIYRFQSVIFQRTEKGAKHEEVTELDLSNADLRRVDLSKFVNLKILNLRNNQLQSIKEAGIQNCKHLKAIDLRDNQIKTVEDIADLIQNLPELEAVGLIGNRFSRNRKYRSDVLKLLPKLRTVTCPLYELDEEEITVDEIVESWTRASGSDKAAVARFRFDVAIQRRIFAGAKIETMTELALKDSHLTYTNFSGFTNLKRLSLFNNEINCAALTASSLTECKNLVELDLRSNRIDDIRFFAQLIDSLPSLQKVWLDHNPCFEKNNKERRAALISHLKQMRTTGATLKYINNDVIELNERCDALKGSMDNRSVEKLRFDIMVTDILQVSADATELVLNGAFLTDISGITRFPRLQKLVMKNNQVKTLVGTGISALKYLQVLDIRDNLISDVDATLNVLRFCDNLRELWMERCDAEGEHVQVHAMYAGHVLQQLRGLEKLDGIENPTRFTADQWEAATYLYDVCGQGPNNLKNINFANKGIEKHNFWAVLIALSTIITDKPGKEGEMVQRMGPHQITLREGNFQRSHVPEYRFMIIHHVPTLQLLDGNEVSLEEHENATKVMEQIIESRAREKEEARRKGEPAQKGFFAGDKLTLSGIVAGEKLAMTMAQDGGAAMSKKVDFKYIEAKHEDIPIISDFAMALTKRNIHVEALGSIISKWEIVISYLQIFSILFSFKVPFPNFWVNIISYIAFVNIDFDFVFPDLPVSMRYLKFAAIMATPSVCMIMYALNFNRESWTKSYVKHWTRTRWRYFGLIILAIVVGGLVAIPMDWQSVKNLYYGKMPTNLTLSIWLVIAGFFSLIIIFLYLNALLFRWKCVGSDAKAETFWITWYFRYRQRMALFFITISFMPVLREVLITFTCDKETCTTLANFPDQKYPKSWSDVTGSGHGLPIMWYIAGAFGVIYAIGIPIFFAKLINRGVNSIVINYSLDMDDRELQQLKQKLKADKKNKDLKKQVQEKEKYIEDKYSSACVNFKNASSYLYSSYERKMRYYKIFQMTEKLFLICVSLFVSASQKQNITETSQSWTATAVVGFYMCVAVMTRPFADNFEDIGDSLGRLANTLNAVIGGLIVTNISLPDWFNVGYILAGINGINVAYLFGNFFAMPIRLFMANRALALKLAVAVANAGKDAAKDVVAAASAGGAAVVAATGADQVVSDVGSAVAEDLESAVEELDNIDINLPTIDLSGLEGGLEDSVSGLARVMSSADVTGGMSSARDALSAAASSSASALSEAKDAVVVGAVAGASVVASAAVAVSAMITGDDSQPAASADSSAPSSSAPSSSSPSIEQSGGGADHSSSHVQSASIDDHAVDVESHGSAGASDDEGEDDDEEEEDEDEEDDDDDNHANNNQSNGDGNNDADSEESEEEDDPRAHHRGGRR